jgi:gas vesicle structural protein
MHGEETGTTDQADAREPAWVRAWFLEASPAREKDFMAVALVAGDRSLIDVLDRVLDKGIVIDAWMRVSLAGLDLVEVEARVVVASINTYLTQASALAELNMISPPLLSGPGRARRRVRNTPYVYPRVA